MSDDFYLHEDEWGMISLEPVESLADRREVVAKATAHAEAHRAPGGIGWTAMYMAPRAPIEIAARSITLDALAAVLGPAFTRYAKVISGYSSHREDVAEAYAFRPRPPIGDGDDLYVNRIYGVVENGVVGSLCISRCEPSLAETLHGLGTTFRLILCDLWSDEVVDLADRLAIERYLAPLVS